MTLILALAGAPQSASRANDLNTLIDGVDRTFASMKDFSADFVQISTISLNQPHVDEGHLYLTRDRKMRWEYKKSEEKLFISNGKTLYSYIPLDREVTEEKVKDATAERIPMMFLVGRANLRKEFKEFEELKIKPWFDGDRVIRLYPIRKNEDIQSIEIEVNPRNNLIDRMVVLGTDKSRSEFIFMRIETNTNIPASKFEFKPPPGTRVVQGVF